MLYDLGYVTHKEPFSKLFNQGMILGQDGSKMSKSKGNVINPDLTVDEYGSDSMRIYEMFMGPLDKAKPWSTTGLQGCSRFIKKLWSILVNDDGVLSNKINEVKDSKETLQKLHSMIKKVSNNLDQMHFNTCVSEFMIFTNHIQKLESININTIKSFIVIMNPFMPHLCQELWEMAGQTSELSYVEWPKYDENLAESDEVIIPIQINGKRRSEISINLDMSKEKVIDMAKSDAKIISHIKNAKIIKEIYIPGKIFNIVIKT